MFEKQISELSAKPDETIFEHNEKLLKASQSLFELNYIDEEFKKTLDRAIYYHDLGKMNQHFQDRLLTKSKFNSKQEIGHNILSYFLMLLLEEKDETYFHELYAVLNHHHYVNNIKAIREQNDLIYTELQLLLVDSGKIFSIETLRNKTRKAENKFKKIKNDDNEKKKLILLKGLLHKCDYSASAGLPIEYPADFLEDSLDLMMEKWRENPKEKETIPAWNEMQTFCRENQDSNLVITAQTGMGKTEAALLWIGRTKGFFVLPLRTAINAIYNRVKDEVLQKKNIDKRVALIHGDMMSVYRSQLEDSEKAGNKNSVEEEYDLIDYYNKSRNFSYPLNISTPDQLFDFVFAYPGYELKLAMLSYSKIVIDEIQAYNPDLLAYIILGIQRIHKMGGKFAIFTATLPPFVEDLLGKTSRINNVNLELDYKKKVFINDLERHNLKVLEKEIDIEDVIKIHQENIDNGKSSKCLIVCNTVKKAQELYKELTGLNLGYKVTLLHSKFTRKDRADKETTIMKTGDTDCFSQEIWISTQIVEASLDIDFDYLFTELSDLTGLFQRLGRVNRKGLKSVHKTNAYVYTEISPTLLIRRDKIFIDKGIYELSKKALLEFGEGVLTESDKNQMINDYLTTEELIQSNTNFLEDYWAYYDYVSKLQDNETPTLQVEKKFRNIISFPIIPLSVIEGEDQEEIEEILEGFSDIDKVYLEAREKKEKLTDQQKSQVYLKRSELKEKLEQYVVQVGHYDFDKNQIDNYWTEKIPDRLNINVVDCEYSRDEGYKRKKFEKPEINKCEEKGDNFSNFL